MDRSEWVGCATEERQWNVIDNQVIGRWVVSIKMTEVIHGWNLWGRIVKWNGNEMKWNGVSMNICNCTSRGIEWAEWGSGGMVGGSGVSEGTGNMNNNNLHIYCRFFINHFITSSGSVAYPTSFVASSAFLCGWNILWEMSLMKSSHSIRAYVFWWRALLEYKDSDNIL